MHKNLVTVGVAVLLAGVIVYTLREKRSTNAQPNAQGVTSSRGGSIRTTPIQTTAARNQAEKPFQVITSFARRILSIPASVIQDRRPLTAYSNDASAAAAASAPLRPDYRAAFRAKDAAVIV